VRKALRKLHERLAWPATRSGREAALGIGLALLGIVVIIAGGVIGALDEYEQSICVNLGTALVLFGPLLYLERRVVFQIRAVSEKTDAAAENARVALRQTEDLATRVQNRLEEIRERDQELAERAARGEDQADLVALYKRASANHSIDRLGLRLPSPEPMEHWLRLRVISRNPEGAGEIDLVEMRFENGALQPIGREVTWSPGEAADQVFVGLAQGLQEAGEWPGDEAFDASAILAAFVEALQRVIAVWSGPGGNPRVRPIAALLPGPWAVTRFGLDSLLTPDVWVEGDELIGDTHHAFMRIEQAVKVRGWDDWGFREAFAEAERVHKAFERERRQRLGG
jgi:hypothetical protein